jgi:hypothetical protein
MVAIGLGSVRVAAVGRRVAVVVMGFVLVGELLGSDSRVGVAQECPLPDSMKFL